MSLSRVKQARHGRRLAISSVWFWQASQLMRLWLTRVRQRRELRELDPRQVQEAGLDPERIRREAAKRFWQA